MNEHYDVLVIGGGPGGTPAAMALAQAGKKVLLVEAGAGLGGTCLFETPEMAMAGLTEAQAVKVGMEVGVAHYDFAQDARAQIDDNVNGLLKILYEKRTRRVVGVHVLMDGAADLLDEAALLVRVGLPLEAIAAAIHPHPTLTESFVMAARATLAAGAMKRHE